MFMVKHECFGFATKKILVEIETLINRVDFFQFLDLQIILNIPFVDS